MTKNLRKEEREEVAKAMNEAGYKSVTADMVEKSENQFGTVVYIAVVGDAMAVYTPEYKRKPVKFYPF